VSGPAGPDPLLVAASAHVFVDDLRQPRLDDADHRHLARVLRLRAGESVTASDGRGRWMPCRFGTGDELVADGEVRESPNPEYEITIAFVPPKGDRSELIVQKLTELGVDRITVMTADHSVVRWDPDRAAKAHRRFVAIAREAAMQSRRVRLPMVEPVTEFAVVADRHGATLAVPGGALLERGMRSILIGPEGGWSAEELRRPLSRVGLGETVLRVETAAIAACALAVSARAKLVGE
jgi:16S rRNA (uracil1498-N3)-methyltransferase